MSAIDEEAPAVTWPVWHRLRYFGGAGVLCAAAAIAVELFIADIPGGRAFNQFSRTGSSPLWPTLAVTGVAIATSGVAIGALLPLYRHRYGGAVIGLIVYLIIIATAFAIGRDPTGVRSDGELWQLVVVLLGFGVIAALSGSEARPLALGKPDESSPTDSLR
jgi:hypothetical protein